LSELAGWLGLYEWEPKKGPYKLNDGKHDDKSSRDLFNFPHSYVHQRVNKGTRILSGAAQMEQEGLA
jgi:hypothetical protein